jgi:hypothetical protein
LAHPFPRCRIRFCITFTVVNGLIMRLQDQRLPQTAQGLAALPTPAGAHTELPITRARDPNAGIVLLVLGTLCALAGGAMRKFSLLHR